jgi:hypothetical protein
MEWLSSAHRCGFVFFFKNTKNPLHTEMVFKRVFAAVSGFCVHVYLGFAANSNDWVSWIPKQF